jgi:long-chain acyl-CoA synthetase
MGFAKHLAWMTMLALAASAAAVEVDGIRVDDKVSVGGQDLMLNGAGLRKRAIFKVYIGCLYLPAKAGTIQDVLAKEPRRIQLNVLRNLSSDQLITALVDGLKQNLPAAEVRSLSRETGELAAIMKSFGEAKEGSVVTIDFVDGTTQVGLDGTVKGSIAGAAFNEALTKIWIGDHPVQDDLKKAMLGGA